MMMKFAVRCAAALALFALLLINIPTADARGGRGGGGGSRGFSGGGRSGGFSGGGRSGGFSGGRSFSGGGRSFSGRSPFASGAGRPTWSQTKVTSKSRSLIRSNENSIRKWLFVSPVSGTPIWTS